VIHEGRLVAQGTIAELQANGRTLEDRFLEIVGADSASVGEGFAWLR